MQIDQFQMTPDVRARLRAEGREDGTWPVRRGSARGVLAVTPEDLRLHWPDAEPESHPWAEASGVRVAPASLSWLDARGDRSGCAFASSPYGAQIAAALAPHTAVEEVSHDPDLPAGTSLPEGSAPTRGASPTGILWTLLCVGVLAQALAVAVWVAMADGADGEADVPAVLLTFVLSGGGALAALAGVVGFGVMLGIRAARV